jgi:transcriptional regulator with XRE-family HTH domain
MNIGKTIRRLRMDRGLKAKDLAEKVDITPEFLSKIENNDKKPSWVTMSDIAKALGVTLPYLMLASLTKDDLKEGEEQNFLDIKHSLEKLLNDLILAEKN